VKLSFFKPRVQPDGRKPPSKSAAAPDSDDQRLIDTIVAGEQSGLLGLYDRYSARVHGLVTYIVGTSTAAEEVTQDTFLKVWQQAATFRAEQGTVATWLFTIARRTAIDRLRYENRRPSLSEGDGPETLWRDLPAPGSDSDEARWRALHFAVQALPAEQRQVIELAYYGGLSHSQIADELAWPLGTVKTRLRLGMEQLRREWLPGPRAPGTSKEQAANVSIDRPAMRPDKLP
jgi:RNA polymerase sigma-70 factor (ECF subfamily)